MSLNSERSKGTIPTSAEQDQPRGLLVRAPAEPDEVGSVAARLEVRVGAGLGLVPLADQQQDQLRHASATARAAAPSPCGGRGAERHRDDRAAGSGAGRSRRRADQQRGAARLAVSSPSASETTIVTAAREAAGCRSSSRRAGAARRRRRLVAVPAPVPQLRVRVVGDQPRASGYWSGWKITIAARHAGQPQPPRLLAARPSPTEAGQPQVGAVGHPRGLDGDDARRAQQVLGLVAQDEPLERAREQQDRDRRRLSPRRARPARRPPEGPARHPKPPAGSVISDGTLASQRDDELPATAAAHRAAYQLADAVSKVVALALLPVYTQHLTRADYGTAELVLTTIILCSIVLRLGLGEAFVRFHYLDADPARRRRIARTATGRCSRHDRRRASNT